MYLRVVYFLFFYYYSISQCYETKPSNFDVTPIHPLLRNRESLPEKCRLDFSHEPVPTSGFRVETVLSRLEFPKICFKINTCKWDRPIQISPRLFLGTSSFSPCLASYLAGWPLNHSIGHEDSILVDEIFILMWTEKALAGGRNRG
jgi:hypothetical protein